MWRSFFRRKLVQPLLELLKQGVTPDKLAMSVGLGLSLGIFPMIGSTTLLCGIIGYVLRVNQPAIQLINYFAYPLQLALFIPFFQAGAWLFGDSVFPFTVEDVLAMLKNDPWQTIQSLWWANVRAVVVWCMIGPLVALATYRILKPVFMRIPLPEQVQ